MTITTVSDSQWSILDHIRQLHNADEPFQVDLTYGKGNFYPDNQEPLVRMDIDPEAAATRPVKRSRLNLVADVLALPFARESIASIVFDPPFIHAPGVNSIMGNRFGGYPSQRALREMYSDAALQIGISLQPGGLLVWKCQDIVESGRQVWNHVYIHDLMCDRQHPFEAIDLFILTRTTQIRGHNHGNQLHARRAHSYFWVFRKNKPSPQSPREIMEARQELKREDIPGGGPEHGTFAVTV